MILQCWTVIFYVIFLTSIYTLPYEVAAFKYYRQETFSVQIDRIILSHLTRSIVSSGTACAVLCIVDHDCCSASYNDDNKACLLGMHCSPEMEYSANFKTFIINLKDVAYEKSAKQSSVFRNLTVHNASRAVDGDFNTWIHTEHDNMPFWIIDLEKIYEIKWIEIFNIKKGYRSSGRRLHDLDITVGPTENEMKLCAHYVGPAKLGEHLVFECLHEDIRYVKLMINDKEILHVVEVKVYA